METFPRHWPFVRGIHRPPVNSPHKGQWRGDLMFSLICVWINGRVNNREASDLRRYSAHYDVIVMYFALILVWDCPFYISFANLWIFGRGNFAVKQPPNNNKSFADFFTRVVFVPAIHDVYIRLANFQLNVQLSRKFNSLRPHICVSKLTIIGSDNGLSKFMHFHSRKCIWKCRLENGRHLVSASMW